MANILDKFAVYPYNDSVYHQQHYGAKMSSFKMGYND
jgi:hypothetical protein